MIGERKRFLLHIFSYALTIAGATSLSRPALANPSSPVPTALLAPLDDIQQRISQSAAKLQLPDDLRVKAERGDVQSQRFLGDFYSLRAYSGSAGDAAEAMAWWQKAAGQGDLGSMNKLAGAYAVGLIVPRDAAQSVAWARKAADRDDPGAELQLGSAYGLGFGVPKDKNQAIAWLRRAEAHGGMTGNMARGAIAEFDGQDRPPTPAPADFDSLHNRAMAGNADAQLRLGQIYADGTSALKDDQQAASWFARAAQHGNAQAMSELSARYSWGIGVPRDQTKAAFWLRQAANRGRIEDEISLSDAYYIGTLGEPKDMTQSVTWLQRAAEQGSAKAQYTLAILYQTGQRGLRRDDAAGLLWLMKSANQHYCPAEQMMAERYALGIGSSRDEVKARAWYAKAADHPDSDICQNISADSLKALDGRVVGPH